VTDQIVRPYRDDDATPVTALLNAIEAAGGSGHHFTEDEVRGEMARIQARDLDTRLVVAGDGSLAAVGIVVPPPPGGSRAHADGGVHPGHRGRGIGRALLAWQFQRAVAQHAALAPAVPWTMHVGAGAGDADAPRLFRRFGLRLVRHFLEMSAATAGARPARLPGGLRTAAYTGDLRSAVHRAHTEAFADHWGSESRSLDSWALRTVDSDPFRADLSRVAFDGDQLAGYLLAYDGAGGELYLGQIGTRRPWRKRGLASALVADSLAAGARAGLATSSLRVDADSPTGAVAVYERLGFSVRRSPYAAYARELLI
jgi:mycothiol synthase